MDHATLSSLLLATPFAASLLPLAAHLLPIIARIGHLVVAFRAAEITPSACYDFETRLADLTRELARTLVEWAYNHVEPEDRHAMPPSLRFEGDWYRRRTKTHNRAVATPFGTITLRRYLYQPIHGVERSIFPLEIRLGLVAGRATPALAERVALAATESTQEAVRADLKRDRGVAWSVTTLRRVIAGTRQGLIPHVHDARVAQVLAWLERARVSKGGREPVLAAGRDGVFVPIRGDDSYREAATATLSVYDRSGRRLGTVYLGRMPEPGQASLTDELTRLITAVLGRCPGELPRLAYITDAGSHPTEYYRRVLKVMGHPSRPGERLEWKWVVDFYHVSSYVSKLAESLFRDPRLARAWARRMGRMLKEQPRAMYRLLHSAAALRKRRMMVGASREAYRTAYDYLRKHLGHVDYVEYRADHLPIGSGVTEAACKTVFSERLKRSGMGWSVEGGQRIVDLRVIRLSGVWSPVYRSYLQAKEFPESGTRGGSETDCSRKAA